MGLNQFKKIVNSTQRPLDMVMSALFTQGINASYTYKHNQSDSQWYHKGALFPKTDAQRLP